MSLLNGYDPVNGTKFDILSNTGSSSISGNFTGLPESATFTMQGVQYSITYKGGASTRDVVLTTLVTTNASTTTLTDNGPTPSLLGQAVGFTVAVNGSGATTGDTVLLEDASNGNAVLGSSTLSSGSATFSAPFATIGTHNLFAAYLGNATTAGSQSSQVGQTVAGLISYMGGLPALETTNQFNISWSGTAAPGWSIANFTIFVSDNGSTFTALLTNTTLTSTTFSGQNGHIYTFFSIANGTDNLGNPQASVASAATTTTVRSVPVTTLIVTSFTPTATGFTATFSKPFLNTVSNPVHLYSAAASNANYGPADVTLVGKNTGPVTGSLIVNSTNTGFTFIKTDLATGGGTGGLLAPDTYNVTFLSGPLAFQDTSGNLLDGTSSGVGGANYTNSFFVTAPAANTVTVSVPDFARGPDVIAADSINLVNVQPSPLTGGIPITVNIPAGATVTTAVVTLQYSTSQLTINSAFPNAGLNGSSFTLGSTSIANGNATTVLNFNINIGSTLLTTLTNGNFPARRTGVSLCARCCSLPIEAVAANHQRGERWGHSVHQRQRRGSGGFPGQRLRLGLLLQSRQRFAVERVLRRRRGLRQLPGARSCHRRRPECQRGRRFRRRGATQCAQHFRLEPGVCAALSRRSNQHPVRPRSELEHS